MGRDPALGPAPRARPTRTGSAPSRRSGTCARSPVECGPIRRRRIRGNRLQGCSCHGVCSGPRLDLGKKLHPTRCRDIHRKLDFGGGNTRPGRHCPARRTLPPSIAGKGDQKGVRTSCPERRRPEARERLGTEAPRGAPAATFRLLDRHGGTFGTTDGALLEQFHLPGPRQGLSAAVGV
jgi:hypothetical protein